MRLAATIRNALLGPLPSFDPFVDPSRDVWRTKRDLFHGMVLLRSSLGAGAFFILAFSLASWLRISAGGSAELPVFTTVEFAPPPITRTPLQPPRIRVAAPRPESPPAAIPVPVHEDAADATTIANQDQMPFASAVGDTGLGDSVFGGAIWGTEDGTGLAIPETMLDFDTFVAVEEQPVLLENVTPEYPKMAREAGIEGIVIVRVIVGKDGRVVDAIVGKSVYPLLDDAALSAAWKCTFKPGIQNGHAVAVPVAVPFNFHLR